MSEINECHGSTDLVQCFITAMRVKSNSGEELHLQNLWSDPTETKVTQASKSRAVHKNLWVEAGHVYVLQHNANIMHGQRDMQTLIYPDLLENKTKVCVIDQNMYLDEARLTLHDVLLGFKNIFDISLWGQAKAEIESLSVIKVKLFVHIMAQTITKVLRQEHKFKVGIAFEFKNWVLAFISCDL
ncbi:hypothetical protein BDY19DRAFT_904428 [Irpex rosettiformis]|uniref:Uncharacterized protein n=1 Tax=Irpex rosettiformis TaxID=378272 RepID=A0ACB8U9Q2_9APHY|nr:hypothetical protein BDY19DRAFT_904428 [Irpex rosettiformis]